MTIKATAAERLGAFIEACNYGGDLGRSDKLGVIGLISGVFANVCDGDLPDADRRLLKMAAAAVAFHREIKRINTEPVQLDFREEEILSAVLEHLAAVGEN